MTTTYRINVVAVQMTSMEIFLYPKTSYYAGNTLTSSGLTLEINYNDSSIKRISSGYTIQLEGYDVGVHPTLITLGTKKVLVTYTENGILQTVEYEIEVLKDSITGLQITQDPRTTYNLWDKFNYSGMSAYAVYASGEAKQITLDESMFSVKTFEEVGSQTVTLNYEGLSAQIGCMVNAPTSISITKNLSQTEYEIGETVSAEGVEASILFPDGSTKTVDQSRLTFTYPSTGNAGNANVWVSFGDLKTYYDVTIIDPALAEDAPRIVIQSRAVTKGQEFTVAVEIKNNPGVASVLLNIAYDESVLTLVEVKDTGLISGKMHSSVLTSPYQLSWMNGTLTEDNTEDGIIVNLVFKVNDNAELGDYNIALAYDYDNYDIINVDMEPVQLYTVGSVITIADFMYGDVNNDGRVNLLDSTILARYVAKWPDYTEDTLNMQAADVNNDGRVNLLDSTILERHVAKWPAYSELPYAN